MKKIASTKNLVQKNTASFLNANDAVTLTELAQETGISRRTLHRLAGTHDVQKTYQPTPETLEKLASAIGTSVKQLTTTELQF
jgi:DNA-binding Xre family transcriptional regulator